MGVVIEICVKYPAGRTLMKNGPSLLVAEEPQRSTTLNLEHYTLPAQGQRGLSYLSSSPRKDEQRTAPEWPRLPLTQPLKGVEGN
jgi:hypothetical protein